MVEAVEPGGQILDLQVILPKPRIESEGRVVCELVVPDLFRKAHAAAAAVDALVAERRLLDEAVDDHDALTHYPDGAELVADFNEPERSLPQGAAPILEAIRAPCARRDRCRLRRLRVASS